MNAAPLLYCMQSANRKEFLKSNAYEKECFAAFFENYEQNAIKLWIQRRFFCIRRYNESRMAPLCKKLRQAFPQSAFRSGGLKK